MKKVLFLTLAFFLLFAGCLSNQDSKQKYTRANVDQMLPPPEGTLPSGVVYADLEKEIDIWVEKYKDKMAAMSVSVFTAQGVLLEKTYGYTNIEDKVLNDADTTFEWGSITKTLTWVSAMQLVEQKKLDLNADIRKYIPKGFFSKLRYDDPITMLHLMNHTSGWPFAPHGVSVIPVSGDYKPVGELADELRKLEPIQNTKPGESQVYSNYSTSVAAYVIECISGMPFYEYVRTNIFEPLGMKRTALKADLSDNEWVKLQRERLNCYWDDSLLGVNSMGTAQEQYIIYPAAMGTGTISDLRRYGQALLADTDGNSPLFKKSKTLALLYEPTNEVVMPGDYNFNHGFIAFKRSYRKSMIGHSGSTRGCSANLIFDHELGVGIAVMMNQAGGDYFRYAMPDLIFGPYPTGIGEGELEFLGLAKATKEGIRITWTPEDEATEYLILRSPNARGLGTQINEILATGGEYLDTTADPDTSYIYTIVKNGGNAKYGVKAIYRK